jgi:hypothetical protein
MACSIAGFDMTWSFGCTLMPRNQLRHGSFKFKEDIIEQLSRWRTDPDQNLLAVIVQAAGLGFPGVSTRNCWRMLAPEDFSTLDRGQSGRLSLP